VPYSPQHPAVSLKVVLTMKILQSFALVGFFLLVHASNKLQDFGSENPENGWNTAKSTAKCTAGNQCRRAGDWGISVLQQHDVLAKTFEKSEETDDEQTQHTEVPSVPEVKKDPAMPEKQQSETHRAKSAPAPHDGEDEIIKAKMKDDQEHEVSETGKTHSNTPAPHDGEDEIMEAMMEDVSETGPQQMGTENISVVPEHQGMDAANLAFQDSNASRHEWHAGEKPSTKEVTQNCVLNMEVTIYNSYWKSHNGKGYLSRSQCTSWNQAGEKWKLKQSSENGKVNIWGDYWNSHSGQPYMSRGNLVSVDDVGERWQVFEGKNGDGKVAFYNQYWLKHSKEPWLSCGTTWKRLDIGEEWEVKTKNGKNACPSEGLVSELVFKWKWVHTWVKDEKLCKKTGIKTEMSQEVMKSFTQSVTNVLEHMVEVSAEIEGVGGVKQSVTSTKEDTKTWAQSYKQAYSQTITEELDHCLEKKDSDNPEQWAWVAEADFLLKDERALFITQISKFTPNMNLPPKCLPGYGKTVDYQECHSNGYLPGFAAPTPPPPCPEKHKRCPIWKWACTHWRHWRWMRANCAKTCGVCR